MLACPSWREKPKGAKKDDSKILWPPSFRFSFYLFSVGRMWAVSVVDRLLSSRFQHEPALCTTIQLVLTTLQLVRPQASWLYHYPGGLTVLRLAWSQASWLLYYTVDLTARQLISPLASLVYHSPIGLTAIQLVYTTLQLVWPLFDCFPADLTAS